MRYGALALGALLGAGCLPSLAVAQVSPQTMLQGSTARTMNLSGSATAAYNSNVSRLNKSVAPTTGVDAGDTTYTPSINAEIIQPVGQQTVFLTGNLSYRFHQNNKQLDSSRINLTAGGGGSVGPCGTVVTGHYSRARSDVDDLELDVTVLNIREHKEIGVAVACSRPTGIGVVFSGSRGWGENNLPQFQLSNSETTNLSTGLSYGRPSLGSASVFVAYSKTEYPNRPTQTPGTSGFETRAAGLTYQRQLGGRIKATGSVSYSEAEPTGPLGLGAVGRPPGKFTGLTYSGSLSYRASGRLFLSSDVLRQISPTILNTGTFEVQTKYGLSATYSLGSRLKLQAGGQRSEINLNGTPIAGSAPTLTDSRTTSLFGSLSYQQSKRVSLSLGVGTEKRDSDNPMFNYTNNKVSLSLNLTY